MEQAWKPDGVLPEELRSAIRGMAGDFEDSVQRLMEKPAEVRLRNLRNTVRCIDAPVTHRPPPLERYLAEWIEYTRGNGKSLDKRAIRFLCWTPEVAVAPKFLALLDGSGIEIDRRVLAGLVRACHCMWERTAEIAACRNVVRDLLDRYDGADPLLCKWRAQGEALLSEQGPRIMADRLVSGGESLAPFLKEWRIEAQSSFFARMVEIAAAVCRHRLDERTGSLIDLLFKELLPWPGWNPSNFKKEIGAIILHRPMSDRCREMIQEFVLRSEGLGDPRLPENRMNWAGAPHEAKKRMIRWLRQESAYAFTDRVYRQGEGWVWRKSAFLKNSKLFGETLEVVRD